MKSCLLPFTDFVPMRFLVSYGIYMCSFLQKVIHALTTCHLYKLVLQRNKSL